APRRRPPPGCREPCVRCVGARGMRVLSVSVTDAGRHLAARLPWEHVHGRAGETIRARWLETDAFVLLFATGAAIRIVASLLVDKRTDPAVVCVDEAGRF